MLLPEKDRKNQRLGMAGSSFTPASIFADSSSPACVRARLHVRAARARLRVRAARV